MSGTLHFVKFIEKRKNNLLVTVTIKEAGDITYSFLLL